MTGHRDPLDVLRADVVPTDPDPRFAERLRARLESEVLDPKGVTMSRPVTVEETATHEGDVAYASLWVPDVDRAETFYQRVLGWRLERTPSGGRRIGAVTPPLGMFPDPGRSLFLCHAVDDVRATLAKVLAAGGQAGEPTQEPHGFIADCVDNQGMRFAVVELARSARAALGQPGPGELVYLTAGVPDSGLFRDFYGTVFGWTFTPGRVDDGWGVTGCSPMMGMHGNADRPVVVPMYGVGDIDAAVRAVREGGGTASEPEQMPYGTTADCVDDQGMSFYLGQVG